MFEKYNKLAVSQQLPLVLAVFYTLLLTVMAARSGWERAGTLLEQLAFAGLSALLVVGVHLLPALSRKAFAANKWQLVPVSVVWFGAFFLALVGHAEFFTHAEVNAGSARAVAASTAPPPTSTTSSTAASTGEGRSTAVVSAELTKARRLMAQMPITAETRRTDQKQLIAALEIELDEAKKRQQRIDVEQQKAADIERDLRKDQMAKRLESLTGISHDKIMVILSVATALTAELLSVVLWLIALAPRSASTGETSSTEKNGTGTDKTIASNAPEQRNIYLFKYLNKCVNDDNYSNAGAHVELEAGVGGAGGDLPDDIKSGVERVKRGIETGEIDPRPKVEDVRRFLCIGKGKAVLIRRAVLGQQEFRNLEQAN